MKASILDDFNTDDVSPCLECERINLDKNRCSRTCERRLAFLDGKPYTGLGIGILEEIEEEKPLKICEMQNCDKPAKSPVKPKLKKGIAMLTKTKKSHGITNFEARDVKTKIIPEEVVKIMAIEKPEAEKVEEILCVMCPAGEELPVFNKRSQTCQLCYARWRKGVKGFELHPTLGAFTPFQVHHASRIPRKPKKGAEPCEVYSPPLTKEPGTQKEKPTILPEVIRFRLRLYPEIADYIVKRAQRTMLPQKHILLELLSEAIVARKEKEGSHEV